MAMLGTIATIASIASAGLTAVGSIAAGQAQADEANANARIIEQRAKAEQISAEYRAKQLEQQGLEEQAQAQQDAEALRRKKALALSDFQAQAAGSGFVANAGDLLDQAGDIEEYGTLQQQLALYGGTSRRTGLEASAAAERYNAASGVYTGGLEASAYRTAASGYRTAGYLNAASTIVGATGNLAGKYAKKYGYG